MPESKPAPIGSVVERKPTSKATVPQASSSGQTGFPAVQHRSKSAFSRNRDELRRSGNIRSHNVPTVNPSGMRSKPVNNEEWRHQMGRQNEQRVEEMTEEEREEERREIIERFGSGIGDLLERVKQARMKSEGRSTLPQPIDKEATSSLEEVPIASLHDFNTRTLSSTRLSPPPPVLSTSSTRPSSRADRRLRFAELNPEDIHVYESAPPSPRRKPLALPPPNNDGSAISLGQWKGDHKPLQQASEKEVKVMEPELEPEEGTAEYIRRRYFPDAPANEPSLAWMELSSPPSESGHTALPTRFDLNGKPIPHSLSATLPTHLGLHHHADGQSAGYTLDDIFLLSRSSVSAQRATMLGVMARIAHRLSRIKLGEEDEIDEFVGKEEELRKRMVGAGAEAMSERGSVGTRAIQVLWQCFVAWDKETSSEGVELETSNDSAINSLELEFFLPRVSMSFEQKEIASETQAQLLEVLHRLAQHNNKFASSIVTTPALIQNMMEIFVLTPISPPGASLPYPPALEFLVTLSSSSRKNAEALQGPADALLRFITMLPPSSPYPLTLTTALLTSTLRFYTSLASYGLYSHIATTAMSQFVQLGRYIISDTCRSKDLMVSWTNLLNVWMVCAIDPHRSTPSHEILWSQIISWGWNIEVGELEDKLGAEMNNWDIWAGIWRVRTTWLEGSRVNAIRGGSEERSECINTIKGSFEDGKAKDVIFGVLNGITRKLSQLGTVSIERSQIPHLRALARFSNILSDVIRLWLACLPPISDEPLASPPFTLPFSQISGLCAKITTHPLWRILTSTGDIPHLYVYCRPLSTLLSSYLRLSRRLPGISEDLWIAQALSILSKLLPGDEEFAQQSMEILTGLITLSWLTSKGIQVPSVIWERGGMSVIKPFLTHALHPQQNVHIGPLHPTPQSISLATTQRLPSVAAMPNFGLPVNRDWTLFPLDDLLRSGSSAVFKALPVTWDASEVEIVRASLLFTNISRDLLSRFSLTDFALTREEAIFGCMKVFMLEHGQVQNDPVEEVFRDQIVGHFMNNLLQPYTIGAAESRSTTAPIVPLATRGNLEEASTNFLGKTPFYQYYTDFVALYDAISFSDPLFSRLLLPPTSMRYPADYRKYLWNDFCHILKTIRTPADQVLSEDLREYLWPIETDAQMISLYLRSLLKDSLQGFLHLVSLHHIASNIWSDLCDVDWSEDRAKKLMHAIVDQGAMEVVREVVQYQGSGPVASVLPRFDAMTDETKNTRLGCVGRWGLIDRLQGLFKEP